jgi:hypothetical protein
MHACAIPICWRSPRTIITASASVDLASITSTSS